MAGINKVILIGNVGADPEFRTFKSGDKIANLSIATSESWKDKGSGEKKEKTEWHHIKVSGGLVGIVEKYIHKGSKIYIEGKLATRKWQAQDGSDRYSTEIDVGGFGGKLEMLDSKKSSGGGSGGGNKPPAQTDDIDDEVPF